MGDQVTRGPAVRVVYAIATKVAGVGRGTTAYHGARGLYRHGMLQRVLCGAYRPSEIPDTLIRAVGLRDRVLRKLALYDRSGRVNTLQGRLFDAWAARHIEPADIFHTWEYSLRTMRRAKALGMIVSLQLGAPHPRHRNRLMTEEYARWGLRWPRPPGAVEQAVAEVENADYIFYQSEFVGDTYLREGVPAHKLIQVRYGADIERYRPATAAAAHPFRVLFLGQVGLRKGVLYLLEAWKHLGWRDAELWLVGNDDTEVRPLIEPYIDLPGVRRIGHQDDPIATYQGADVFVLPSLDEDAAKVTYEALACGVPLVTTPNTGSIVEHGVQGFIVPVRDPAALAAALDQLRADDRLRHTMARAARARAAQFTWDGYGDRFAEGLRGIMTRRASSKALALPAQAPPDVAQ